MTAEWRARAARFADHWRGEAYERGESQTFWNEFFEIFGRSRRSAAVFERHAKRLDRHGYIDLFWPSKLLIEHKSMGRSLEQAMEQAEEYVVGLPDGQIPRYVLVCDFATFHLMDWDTGDEHRFTLEELPENVGLFGFMVERPRAEQDIDPVNQKATRMMGEIYDSLSGSGYPPGDAEQYLTRLAFCMFADDTDIFEHGSFGRLLDKTDGGTLGPLLDHLFQVLNTPMDKRQSSLDPGLAIFPYVDGHLFEKRLAVAALTDHTKQLLAEADRYNWSQINPAIFGGMFQNVLNAEKRRYAGAHYTAEENIMRVIRPLFLDGLYREFETAKSGTNRRAALERLQDKLAGLRFLDPACGSGNFLAIAYRELRRLELKVILELHDTKTQRLDVSGLSRVDVHQFYGIEKDQFPTRIAEISLWMTDHLMNRELGEKYGIAYARIPLQQSPNVVCADALEIDWNDVIPAAQCSYILGNPPYRGAKIQDKLQRQQVRQIASLGGSGGTLDYVAAWFFRAAQYTEANHTIRIGFVATNSITQGEQAGQLWPTILDNYGMRIQFAYRSFKWGSEAPGMAHVHVVIIGLGRDDAQCRLFHTDDQTLEENPRAISPYMVGVAHARVVRESSRPLNGLPEMVMGSKPIDGGNYIFTDAERDAFLLIEPKARRHMRPYVGAKDYIHRKSRWILALHSVEPDKLADMPHVVERVNAVKRLRLNSKSVSTIKLADTPTLYHLNVLPDRPFLVIPSTSSERRRYVPIGYLEPPIVPSNANMVIPNATLGLFGLLTSRMHMVWLYYVGGRLKSDYRYSAGLVYNTFPVPDSSLDGLESYAQRVLDARDAHLTSTLADLYNPVTMPADLAKAHRKLDRAVDRLYRRKMFDSDLERIEFLLERYEGMIHDS